MKIGFMPEFPLTEDFSDNPLKSLINGYAIILFMAYPDDEQTREEKLQLLHIETYEKLRNTSVSELLGLPPELVQKSLDEVLATEVAPNLSLPDNPIQVLLNSESVTDLKQRLSRGALPKDWITVGFLTNILLTMQEHDFPGKNRSGVSKSRAVYLLSKLEIPFVHTNTKDINDAWTKYRSVSHFCFGYKLLTESKDYQQRFDVRNPQGLINFLHLAQYVEEHLPEIKPTHSRHPRLIQRRELWHLPKWLKLRGGELIIDSFGEKEKENCSQLQYKALSQNIGHEHIMTTYNPYGELNDHARRKAIESIGKQDGDLQNISNEVIFAEVQRRLGK